MTVKIFDQLLDADFTLRNIADKPTMAARLAEWGYGEGRLRQGRAVLAAARAAYNAQHVAHVDSIRATSQARAARTAAWKAYQRVATIARAVLRPHDPLLLEHLGLQHAMPRATDNFLAAAAHLFEGITNTPEIANILSGFGYGAARLASEQALINSYRTALHEQQSAIALARRATRAQQTALQSLGRWMAQFRKVASVALADDMPDLNRQDTKNGEGKSEETPPAAAGAEIVEEQVATSEAQPAAEGDQPAATPSDHIDDQDPTKQQK